MNGKEIQTMIHRSLIAVTIRPTILQPKHQTLIRPEEANDK